MASQEKAGDGAAAEGSRQASEKPQNDSHTNSGHHARIAAPTGEKPERNGTAGVQDDEVTPKEESSKPSKSAVARLKGAVMPPEWVLNNYKNLKVGSRKLACRPLQLAEMID